MRPLSLPIVLLILAWIPASCTGVPSPVPPPARPPCDVTAALLLPQDSPVPAPSSMLVSDLLSRADYLEGELYRSLRRHDALSAEAALCMEDPA